MREKEDLLVFFFSGFAHRPVRSVTMTFSLGRDEYR